MLTLVSKKVILENLLGTYGIITHQIAVINGFFAQDLGNYAA